MPGVIDSGLETGIPIYGATLEATNLSRGTANFSFDVSEARSDLITGEGLTEWGFLELLKEDRTGDVKSTTLCFGTSRQYKGGERQDSFSN